MLLIQNPYPTPYSSIAFIFYFEINPLLHGNWYDDFFMSQCQQLCISLILNINILVVYSIKMFMNAMVQIYTNFVQGVNYIIYISADLN